MLMFENNQKIDFRGITTFGVSAKNNDTSIGYFGTGLKYAIAVILREGGSISLFIGNTKWSFHVNSVKVRKNSFDVVTMYEWVGNKRNTRGKELAFTTELGKNWKLWQAYRELYSNTMDEEGTVKLIDKMPNGIRGGTRIVVEGLDQIHNDRAEFILQTEPLHDLGRVEIHQASEEGGSIFYQGIKVHTPLKEAKFNYNIKSKVSLTEDRTMANVWWDADRNIMEGLLKNGDKELVETILGSTEDTYEGCFDWNEDYVYGKPSPEFTQAVKELSRHHNAYKYYCGSAISSNDFALEAVTELQKSVLNLAKNRVFNIFSLNPSIIPTTLLGEKEYAAKNGTIYVNINLLTVESMAELTKSLFKGTAELENVDPFDKLFTLWV